MQVGLAEWILRCIRDGHDQSVLRLRFEVWEKRCAAGERGRIFRQRRPRIR
jgi:hypothetical protein